LANTPNPPSTRLVETYLSDSGDHVLDVGLESGDGTSVLVGSVPHLKSNVKTLHFMGSEFHDSDIHVHMG